MSENKDPKKCSIDDLAKGMSDEEIAQLKFVNDTMAIMNGEKDQRVYKLENIKPEIPKRKKKVMGVEYNLFAQTILDALEGDFIIEGEEEIGRLETAIRFGNTPFNMQLYESLTTIDSYLRELYQPGRFEVWHMEESTKRLIKNLTVLLSCKYDTKDPRSYETIDEVMINALKNYASHSNIKIDEGILEKKDEKEARRVVQSLPTQLKIGISETSRRMTDFITGFNDEVRRTYGEMFLEENKYGETAEVWDLNREGRFRHLDIPEDSFTLTKLISEIEKEQSEWQHVLMPLYKDRNFSANEHDYLLKQATNHNHDYFNRPKILQSCLDDWVDVVERHVAMDSQKTGYDPKKEVTQELGRFAKFMIQFLHHTGREAQKKLGDTALTKDEKENLTEVLLDIGMDKTGKIKIEGSRLLKESISKYTEKFNRTIADNGWNLLKKFYYDLLVKIDAEVLEREKLANTYCKPKEVISTLKNMGYVRLSTEEYCILERGLFAPIIVHNSPSGSKIYKADERSNITLAGKVPVLHTHHSVEQLIEENNISPVQNQQTGEKFEIAQNVNIWISTEEYDDLKRGGMFKLVPIEIEFESHQGYESPISHYLTKNRFESVIVSNKPLWNPSGILRMFMHQTLRPENLEFKVNEHIFEAGNKNLAIPVDWTYQEAGITPHTYAGMLVGHIDGNVERLTAGKNKFAGYKIKMKRADMITQDNINQVSSKFEAVDSKNVSSAYSFQGEGFEVYLFMNPKAAQAYFAQNSNIFNGTLDSDSCAMMRASDGNKVIMRNLNRLPVGGAYFVNHDYIPLGIVNGKTYKTKSFATIKK